MTNIFSIQKYFFDPKNQNSEKYFQIFEILKNIFKISKFSKISKFLRFFKIFKILRFLKIRNFFQKKYFLTKPFLFWRYDRVEFFKALSRWKTPPDEQAMLRFFGAIYKNFRYFRFIVTWELQNIKKRINSINKWKKLTFPASKTRKFPKITWISFVFYLFNKGQ